MELHPDIAAQLHKMPEPERTRVCDFIRILKASDPASASNSRPGALTIAPRCRTVILRPEPCTALHYVATYVNDLGEEHYLALGRSEENDLSIAGAANTVVAMDHPIARSYRFYREEPDSGRFGFIGESEQPVFVDRNYIPDLSREPPLSGLLSKRAAA